MNKSTQDKFLSKNGNIKLPGVIDTGSKTVYVNKNGVLYCDNRKRAVLIGRIKNSDKNLYIWLHNVTEQGKDIPAEQQYLGVVWSTNSTALPKPFNTNIRLPYIGTDISGYYAFPCERQAKEVINTMDDGSTYYGDTDLLVYGPKSQKFYEKKYETGLLNGELLSRSADTAAITAANLAGGFLGSIGEWLIVADKYDTVNELLENAGGTPLGDLTYWTSTQYNDSMAIAMNFEDGTVDPTTKIDRKQIRPFIII